MTLAAMARDFHLESIMIPENERRIVAVEFLQTRACVRDADAFAQRLVFGQAGAVIANR